MDDVHGLADPAQHAKTSNFHTSRVLQSKNDNTSTKMMERLQSQQSLALRTPRPPRTPQIPKI
eukprot:2163308-Amphidinium_carterae.1